MLVKACLNGSRRGSEHPAVPIDAAAITRDAAAVAAVGAGAVHIHPRDAQGTENRARGARADATPEPVCRPNVHARRRDPGNCTFVVGVAQDLDLPDCSFDVVTSTLAVHHIPDTMRAAAFGEMYRVLRPGGRLLVADFRPACGSRAIPPFGRVAHDHNVGLLDDVATTAGFSVEARGDLKTPRYLPKVRYIRGVRPPDATVSRWSG